jgi:hypothetical protein
LKRLQPYLEDFRTAIIFLNSSNQRIASYKQYCLSVGVRPRKFGVNMDVRWNSTFLMLKHLAPYQTTFSVWIKTNHPSKSDGFLLTENHWCIAEKLLSFLQLFYDSTVALPGVYYPTSPLMLHHILKIARHLNAFEKSYTGSSKATKACDDIYGDDETFSAGTASGSVSGAGAATLGTGSSSSLSELSSYLDSDTKTKFGLDFNILSWWQRHNQTYPILSILARDVMTVHVSTISSEYTFSLASRVLEEQRRLATDMVEVLSCIKDWELADQHKQHTAKKETKELESAFEAMYLDDEQQVSPGSKRKEGGSAAGSIKKKDKSLVPE